MKKMFYILFLLFISSSFLSLHAQHNISIRLGVNCSSGIVYGPSTDITEGTLYTVGDWTIPSAYASIQPIYDAIKGSTFQLESGALTEDIQIDWILYNMSCTNGTYLPDGSLTEVVFNGYFLVKHQVSGVWTPQEPYAFNNNKSAILSIQNTSAFQSLIGNVLTGGALQLAFSYYAKSTNTFTYSGLTYTPPSPIDDPNGFWVLRAAHFSNIVGGNKNQITGVNDIVNSVPTEFGLKQNYPNPFNPSTLIEYSIPEKSYVELNVYNILGVKVANLVKSSKEAGIYKVEFNGSELSSGLYIYELKTNKATISRKMLLLK